MMWHLYFGLLKQHFTYLFPFAVMAVNEIHHKNFVIVNYYNKSNPVSLYYMFRLHCRCRYKKDKCLSKLDVASRHEIYTTILQLEWNLDSRIPTVAFPLLVSTRNKKRFFFITQFLEDFVMVISKHVLSQKYWLHNGK